MMKVTATRSRRGAAVKHNRRDFDLGAAKHIDQERTHNNTSLKSTEQEMEQFHRLFGKALAEQNERYIRNRHRERVMTEEQAFTARNSIYKPQEIILQIGNKKECISDHRLQEALLDFNRRLRKQYPELVVSNWYVHRDEATPHIHFDYFTPWKDENGELRLGNNARALESWGVELPHPDKPEGKHNTRVMTFCASVRELWADCVERKGIEVDRVPSERSREHLEKDMYILGQEVEKRREELEEIRQRDIEHGQKLAASYERLLERIHNPEIFINEYMAREEFKGSEEFVKWGDTPIARQTWLSNTRSRAKKAYRQYMQDEAAAISQGIESAMHGHGPEGR